MTTRSWRAKSPWISCSSSTSQVAVVLLRIPSSTTSTSLLTKRCGTASLTTWRRLRAPHVCGNTTNDAQIRFYAVSLRASRHFRAHSVSRRRQQRLWRARFPPLTSRTWRIDLSILIAWMLSRGAHKSRREATKASMRRTSSVRGTSPATSC